MTRQQYLWLFIWIFIFFLIFCVWYKLPHYAPTVTENTPAPHTPTPIEKKMHFKVIKEQNSAILSGIVANENEKDTLLDAYGKVFEVVDASALHIEDHVKTNGMLAFFANFADNFSKFDAGYLAFSNGNLEVDGIAQAEIIKQRLDEQLATLKDISIDNRLFINKEQKAPADNTHTTKNQIVPKTTEEIQKDIDALLHQKRVQFLYARDILTSGSKLLIDDIAKILQKNSNISIEIAGHTDSDGTKARNIKLSKKRAQSVKRYLISKGIEENRMQTVGYGESRPLVPNSSKKNREINRRVEFKVLGEKQ